MDLPPDGRDEIAIGITRFIGPPPCTITFAFTLPVEPQSVALVDVDSGDGPLHVVLTDGAGRRRTYTVPSNWTGDILLAQPGRGTLDLTTLAPQSGFGSTATAVEDSGFDALGVVELAFVLDGSTALDDLALCAPRAPRAATSSRNGSGANPEILRSVARPVFGSRWNANLDCTSFGPCIATLVARRSSTQGHWSPLGEVLIDGALLGSTSNTHPGVVHRLGWEIPFDVSLCGVEVHVQGLCSSSAGFGGPKPGRARKLSNALDLVLGF
ncbi:MAG: hypothetical protein HOP15_00990 [Planctomycetes bacterium]|nr:hypothetical protein [Planctomycetota bacterium]